MEIYPVTDRIKKLRELYLGLPIMTRSNNFYYTHDRWISPGFLEGWLKHTDAVTTTLRRSLAEASELDAAEPVIYDGELILGHIYFPEYTKEQRERYDELSKMFIMSPSPLESELYRARPDHIGLDYGTLLRDGISGLLDRIRAKKAGLCYEDDDFSADSTLEKEEFYDCCIIELEAVLRLAERYEKSAREAAEKAEDARRAELLEMADIIARVPKYGARTFREALQSMHFYTYNMFGLYPIGRPDRLLYDYYENDIKNGVLTPELAQELVDNYCLLISDYVFHRAASGFIVGGRRADGSVVENELSYIFLNALEHIRMPDPNGALAVCSDTSDEILNFAVDIVSKRVTHPAFYNDDAISASLRENYGVDREESYEYIHTTCAEISVMGKSRTYTTCYVNFLSETVKETVRDNPEADFEGLLADFKARLKSFANTQSRMYMMKILEASRNGLQPQRVSCLVADCIERGKSVYQGGAKYNFLQPIFVGFANAVDSFVAIRELVFEQKRLTLAEFYDICEHNFEGNEALRSYIINKLPHYGNDDPDTDALAGRLAGFIAEIYRSDDVYMSKYTMPGTFSYDMHSCGERFGAGFDGRPAGESFSDGCCPGQGRDTHGPTALIKSMTSWDQSEFLSGMVVNMKFASSAFDKNKAKNLARLIKTFVARGGIETQINVVDRKTLEDARINPEKHADLIVRIGGYSDYFVKQNPVMQQEIIDRTEN